MTAILSHPWCGVAILVACVAAAGWLRRRKYSHRLLSLATWLVWTAWLCSGPAATWAPAIGSVVNAGSGLGGFLACLLLTVPVALLLAWLRTRALDEETPDLARRACLLQSFELHCGCIIAALLYNAVWNPSVRFGGLLSGWLLPLLAAAAAWHAAEQSLLDLWLYRHVGQATPLAECALRRRVEQLAEQLGLPAPQVWRIPGEGCDPNAFGGRSGVTITDALVATFTRRELDVVLLHELSHARQNTATRCYRQRVVQGFGAVCAALLWLPQTSYMCVLLEVWLVLLVILWRLRAEEYQADDDALTQSQDAAAFITGMVRLHPELREGRPARRWPDWFSTHPSHVARVQHAARRGGLSAEQVRALVAATTTSVPLEERYELPALEAAG